MVWCGTCGLRTTIFFVGPVKADEPKKIVIGMVAKSQSNAVFQAAYAGAHDAAKELGDKYNADITIDWQTPADEDAQKQAQAIEALAGGGRAGNRRVVLARPTRVTPAIDSAVRRGIPVICFDSDAPKSKRLPTTAPTMPPAARPSWQELAKAMGDKGTIAILAGNQSAPNLQARVQGVKEELEKHPNMKLLERERRRFLSPGNAREGRRGRADRRRTPTRRSKAGR